jgi:hypothetical protein
LLSQFSQRHFPQGNEHLQRWHATTNQTSGCLGTDLTLFVGGECIHSTGLTGVQVTNDEIGTLCMVYSISGFLGAFILGTFLWGKLV